jgi:redox-sensitive bicupin YhaK (pirin superfamily)
MRIFTNVKYIIMKSKIILTERNSDIGGFTVGRLLPYRQKRMIGPFIFIDHMGPATVNPVRPFDIGQHPHIGLSTLTYLMEGEILHKDSLGSNQVITAGDVNWMTAGDGVVHTEKAPDHLIGKEYSIHGYQVWVALPLNKEDMEPSFHHISKNDLPKWNDNESEIILVAGKAFGKSSPVPVHSALYMIKTKTLENKGTINCGGLFGEFGICPVEGNAHFEGETIHPGEMLVVEEFNHEDIQIESNSILMIFGGEPFAEKRYIDWNFVSSDKKKIDVAKKRWREKRFRMIGGECSYVPLPK